jgi:predicted NUDIX family phosphoesterase
VSAAGFKLRNDAEVDPMFKQLIPYCLVVFSGVDGDLILHYSRAKSGGEERLHAKRSIGIGGHIEPDDIGDDPWMIALYRELKEETGIEQDMIQDLFTIGFVNDEQNAVGQVHLGVVHIVVVNTPFIPALEEHITDPKWDTFQEIEMEENLETWSQEILSRLHPHLEQYPWVLSEWNKQDLDSLRAL